MNVKIAGRTQKEYDEDNKEKRKEFYETNKDKILENNKEYYEANKEKMQEYQKEKITCECGSIVCKIILARHKRSVKHQEFLKTILTPIIH